MSPSFSLNEMKPRLPDKIKHVALPYLDSVNRCKECKGKRASNFNPKQWSMDDPPGGSKFSCNWLIQWYFSNDTVHLEITQGIDEWPRLCAALFFCFFYKQYILNDKVERPHYSWFN